MSSTDFTELGALEQLQPSLGKLRQEALSDPQAALKYVNKSVTVFRYVLIALFVILFISALTSVIAGGLLLDAVLHDKQDDSSWRNNARNTGAFNCSIVLLLLAFSIYAIVVMVNYERAMGYMLHRVAATGERPPIHSATEHLSQEGTQPSVVAGQGVVETAAAPASAAEPMFAFE